jgi:hypothetical protein
MRVIETIARVGPDGMLRLELPVGQPNQDLQVALVVEPMQPRAPAAESLDDRWASVRGRLTAAGFSVPPPGLNPGAPAEPLELPGMSASEMLVRDRR